MITAFDISNYFLSLLDEECGDLASNLYLQKLAYYAQGCCLALHDKPLFREPLEAWTHGAVVPEPYHHYKAYGSENIPVPTGIDFSIYTEEVRALLDEVYSVFGQFSAWKLRRMNHEELPWMNAYNRNDKTIRPEEMRSYFKTLLINLKSI